MSGQMGKPQVRTDLYTESGLVESAADVTADSFKWGFRLASLPFRVLPSGIAKTALDGSRLGLASMALLPQAALRIVDGLADEVEDLEERLARREDLGRRLRREKRRRERSAVRR